MECPYCGVSVPDHGFYCPACVRQIRCKTCQERLEEHANGCVYCGTRLDDSSSTDSVKASSYTNTSPNRIVLQETPRSRSLEANFTDATANALVGLWHSGGNVFNASSGFPSKFIGPARDAAALALTSESVEILDAPDVEPVKVKEELSAVLNRVCRWTDGKLTFRDTNLKGSTNKDWRMRVTLVGLFYLQEIHDIGEVDRLVLVNALESLGLLDNNYYSELKNRNWLSADENDRFSLTIAGEEKAREFVRDMSDSSKESTTLPVVGKKRRSSAKDVSKSANPEQPEVMTKTQSKSKSATGMKGSEELLRKWDSCPLRLDYKGLVWEKLSRLEQVVLSLHAIHASEEDRTPVSREMIAMFLDRAFGVNVNERTVADAAGSSNGRVVIRHERGKGYALREDGLERAGEILAKES